MTAVQMTGLGPGAPPVLTTAAAIKPGLTVATETLMATPATTPSSAMARPTTSVPIRSLHRGAPPVCTPPMIGTPTNTVTSPTSGPLMEME